MATFKWQQKDKTQWPNWERFGDLLEKVHNIDGPIKNKDWLNDELTVVGELGMSGSFLEMVDSGDRYKNPNHSSLAYFLGVTDEEPMFYPKNMAMAQARKTMPDIDIDFEDRFRQLAMTYAKEKYTYERTAQIITFGEIGAKKAVRDVCRVMGKPYELGDQLSKAMPPGLFGVPATLDECLRHPEFRNLYETSEEIKEIVDVSLKIEGLWRNTGIHAAALLISDNPITDYVPVMQAGEGEPIVTQWDMVRAEECGLLKIDYLSLRNLTIVAQTLMHMKTTHGIDIDNPYKLVDDPDPLVYEMLQRGFNIGVFQMESPGFRELMMDLRPTTIEDLSAMLALYRPGPMGSGVHKKYAARKNGREPVRYFHPSLEPILKDTYGLMLYQEQILEIAKQVAGKDTFEADELRIIVGKKKIEKMAAQRASFVDGCMNTVGMRKADAESLFNDIEHHASYSFNRAHSMSYAFLSYVTAYLKARYPTEYMASCLSTSADKEERMRLYLNECSNLGIEVKRPQINHPSHDFAIVDSSIVYGMDGIKGVGASTVDSIIASRDPEDPYRNIFDFMRRATPEVLNRKTLLNLINSGGLDEILVMDGYEVELTRAQKLTLLFQEGTALGVFLGDHPFNELKYLTLGEASHTIEEAYSASLGSFVKVAGVVTNVEKKSTRAGKRMFIVTVEDDTRSIEAIAFPQFAEKLDEKPFKKGDLIVLSGPVRNNTTGGGDDDSVQLNIIMNDMKQIDYSTIGGAPPIYLKAEKSLDSSRLQKISGIIKASNGSSPVFLEMILESGKTIVIKFDKTTSLDNKEILQQLAEV